MVVVVLLLLIITLYSHSYLRRHYRTNVTVTLQYSAVLIGSTTFTRLLCAAAEGSALLAEQSNKQTKIIRDSYIQIRKCNAKMYWMCPLAGVNICMKNARK